MSRFLFFAFLAAAFLAPLLALVLHLDSAAIQELSESPGFGRSLRATLITGGLGAVLSVFLGAAFAQPFAAWTWRGQRLQRLVFLFPYLVPNFIFAAAYVSSWNPATGLLNAWLPLPAPLYGYFGLVLLFGVTHAPIAFLMAEDKLRRLDPALREAARMAGGGRWAVVRRVELPLVRPTLLAAFGISFALNVSAFAIPAWIGAPERVFPLTYKVYQAMQLGGVEGIPQAAAYSLVLFAITLPLLGLSSWAQRNERRYAVVSGKASRASAPAPHGKSFAAFQIALCAFLVVFVLAPLSVMGLSTLTPPGCLQQRGLACLSDATMRSYTYVWFELSETKAAFFGSGVYGTLAAVLVLVLAVATLMALLRTPKLLRGAESVFALMTATPGAVIALGMIVTYSGRYGINLYNTPWIVVVALILKHQNLAFQPLRTGLVNLSPSLVEAARLGGATPRQAWRRVVLPILRPELVSGFFLVLVPILGELTMSIFLASPRYRSIGTVLFDLHDYADAASAAALSMTLLTVILLLNEAGRRLSGGRIGY